MDGVQADLRAYYEEEARLHLRKPVAGPRVQLRDEFLTLLRAEHRRSVLEFGAGPGRDGQAFVDEGHEYVGIDLAHRNGILAHEAGITVVQGSLAAPPLRPRSFDAGWSMSTLMHIPEREFAGALEAMIVPLRPGAPLVVGMWGGERGELMDDTVIAGQRRMFSLRPLTVNERYLSACGSVERSLAWEPGTDGWQYQVFQIRIGG